MNRYPPAPLARSPALRRSRHYCLLPTPYSLRQIRVSGFTLVEMLIALALTLILVYAIAHFYAIVGDAVKDGRGMIEMNQQLRAVVERLKDDLDRLTVPVVPWADEGGAEGYFEYREGPASDWDVNANYRPDSDPNYLSPDWIDLDGNGTLDGFAPEVTNLLGDLDDFWAGTIRAGNTQFTGQTVAVDRPTGFLMDASNTVLNGSPFPTKIANPPAVIEISAPFAEVAWWTSFADQVDPNSIAVPPIGNKAWDLKETRFIHRRQLLIRPDLNVLHPSDPIAPTTPYFCRVPLPSPINSPTAIWLYDIHQFCDVSIRPLGLSGGFLYFAANSLADLGLRQNRFMHVSALNDSPPTATPPLQSAFPYKLDLNPDFAGDLRPDLMPDNAIDLSTTYARHHSMNDSAIGGSLYRWVLMDGGRKGEDIMLPNVLAFDIRVYDPDAVLRPDDPSSPSGVIQPGDPGYIYANGNNFNGTHNPYGGHYAGLVGPPLRPGLPTGAYVDLGYFWGLANALNQLPTSSQHRVPLANSLAVLLGNPTPFNAQTCPTLGTSRFAGPPAMVSLPPTNNPSFPYATESSYALNFGHLPTYGTFTYDTWTLAYERDGINQNGNIDSGTGQQLVDEGRDGVDSPNLLGAFINGVDDAGERETVPPYAHPLRGIQIRIRMYEPGTRQMRQSTVIGDFLPE